MMTSLSIAAVVLSLTWITLILRKLLRSFPWAACERADLVALPAAVLYLVLLVAGARLLGCFDLVRSFAVGLVFKRQPRNRREDRLAHSRPVGVLGSVSPDGFR